MLSAAVLMPFAAAYGEGTVQRLLGWVEASLRMCVIMESVKALAHCLRVTASASLLLHATRLIFAQPTCRHLRYTRNGELLGDGFVPVFESNLVPVVGFHSNGESVRVNFGLFPFAYEVSSILDTGEREKYERMRH